MTFSQALKEELLVQDIEPETAKIELIAAFRAIGVLCYSEGKIEIEVKTTQIKLLKRIMLIIKTEYPNVNVDSAVRSKNSFKKKINQYILHVRTGVLDMLYDLKLINDPNSKMILGLNAVNLDDFNEEEQKVYAMIFFTSCGSANDPKKSQQYHLEIGHQNIEYLKELQRIIKPYRIKFKITNRKSKPSIYLNKGEEIADFLKFMRSSSMLLDFENYRITRDMKLESNRLANAEVANEVRKIKSTNKQLEDIEKIREYKLETQLSNKTREVIELREKYPNDSLQSLSERTGGSLSKSNIRYHLKIVKDLAEKQQEKNSS